jgi:hypothetical protein
MQRILFLAIACLLMSLVITRSAVADGSPNPPPQGSDPNPGTNPTRVQMVREDVLMTVGDGQIAHVQAVFQFQNQGTVDESFDVWFPAGQWAWNPDMRVEEIVQVKNFGVLVNGENADVGFEESTDRFRLWAYWPTDFPVGQTVEVAVSYDIPSLIQCGPFSRHEYVLETGAGWFDPIGEGTITVRLPHDANEETIPAASPDTHTISGTDVIWHFTDLEPGPLNNISVIVMAPEFQRNLRDARRAAADEPESLDASLYLAHTITGSLDFTGKPCFQSFGLIDEAVDAYEHALELAPNNIDLHIEYLNLAANTLGWISEPFSNTLGILHHALELDPENPELLELEARLSPRLTITPSMESSSTATVRSPTELPLPTATLASTQIAEREPTEAAATAQPAAASRSGCALSGLIMLLPLGALMWSRRRLVR